MGNLVKLGNIVINTDKILKAQIYNVTYPVYVPQEVSTGKKKGFFSGLINAMEVVNEMTGVAEREGAGTIEYRDTAVLYIAYESGDDEAEISLHNDSELAKLFPDMVKLYNQKIDDVEAYRNYGMYGNSKTPATYTIKVCNFIDDVGDLSYINQELEDVLNSLV